MVRTTGLHVAAERDNVGHQVGVLIRRTNTPKIIMLVGREEERRLEERNEKLNENETKTQVSGFPFVRISRESLGPGNDLEGKEKEKEKDEIHRS
jgi:hypothetical protein